MKNYKSNVEIYRGQLFDMKQYFKDFLNGTQNAISNVPTADTFQLNKLDVALDYFNKQDQLSDINSQHKKQSDKGLFVSQVEFEKYSAEQSKLAEPSPVEPANS